MSEKPMQFNNLSADSQDLLAIYQNLRHELVLLTAAGPLMERREKFSKLENGERRGHEEATQIREQVRLFFKLRDILIADGVPLDVRIAPAKQDSAPKSAPETKTKSAAAAGTTLGPLDSTSRPSAFNPGMKCAQPPAGSAANPAYAASLSSTIESPGRTVPVFKTSA